MDLRKGRRLIDRPDHAVPVVATRLDEIEHMESPALLAVSQSEFVTQLRRALERGRDLPEYALFAERNTWEARYHTVGRALSECGALEMAD